MGYFLWQMKILTPSAGPLMVITSALSPRWLSSFTLELSVPNWSSIVIISWMWWRNSYIFERDRCEAVSIIATFAFLVELDLLQKFTNNIILLLFTLALLLFFLTRSIYWLKIYLCICRILWLRHEEPCQRGLNGPAPRSLVTRPRY